jgi:hypothetical protein
MRGLGREMPRPNTLFEAELDAGTALVTASGVTADITADVGVAALGRPVGTGLGAGATTSQTSKSQK